MLMGSRQPLFPLTFIENGYQVKTKSHEQVSETILNKSIDSEKDFSSSKNGCTRKWTKIDTTSE